MNQFRRGDSVWIRGAAEVLATLDGSGRLEGLPFMPEMVGRCGQQAVVASSCDKLCDTVAGFVRSVRMPDTVVLAGERCSGSGHGGCQAQCLIYWKTAWLSNTPPTAAQPGDDEEACRALLALAQANAQVSDQVFRCQATQFPGAIQPLPQHDPRPLVREVLNRDVQAARFVRVLPRVAMSGLTKLRRRVTRGNGPAPAHQPPADLAPHALGLSAGDLVRVREWKDIALTLDSNGKNKGLSFDPEMEPYCGGTYRVRARINHIIDEKSGRMLTISRDCIMLDDVVCSGDRSEGRWFCPRAIFPYWREAWLERVADDPSPEQVEAQPVEAGTVGR